MKVAVPSEVKQVFVITRREKKVEQKEKAFETKATFYTRGDADGKKANSKRIETSDRKKPS